MNIEYFGSKHGDLEESDRIPKIFFIMTFHSSKGLDFKSVFIPLMNDDAKVVSENALDRDENAEKRLLYVAITRSRQNLFISHTSPQPHHLLRQLPKGFNHFFQNPDPVWKYGDDDEDLIDDF